MNNMLKWCWLGIFCLATHLTYATHIVGGDLGMKHLQGNTYQVQFNLYFDIINGDPILKDPMISVVIFTKGSNIKMDTVNLPKLFEKELDYKNPTCDGNFKLRTLHIYYAQNFTFDMARYVHQDGYYMVWQRCCRNAAITNIINPVQAGTTFYTELPLFASITGNSTPIFSVPKAEYLCFGKPAEIDFGATDVDGDELRYYLDTPISMVDGTSLLSAPAPYPLVTWVTGYTANSAIPHNASFPIHQLTANENTGKLTITPSKLGLYVLSLRCEEYRNGIKIGQVIRDFQFLVIDCPADVPPSLRLKTSPQGAQATYYQEGTDIYLTQEACFDLEATDMNFPEKLEFELSARNFVRTNQVTLSPTIAYTTTSSNTVTVKLCWNKCAFSTKIGTNEWEPFIFDLLVKDQSCPLPARDTITVRLINVNDTIPATYACSAPIDTSLQYNYTMTRYANEAFAFNLESLDKNGDLLELSMQGRGFNPTALGMKFTPTNGAGGASGSFYWIKDCKGITKAEQEFILDFKLKEHSKCGIIEKTKSVKLLLLDRGVDFDKFLPPNAFSPNGDKLNPTFEMSGLLPNNCRQDFKKIIIYDRLGRQVFESNKRDFAWDGGGYPPAVYYYVIEFQDRKYKGTISLLR